MFAFTYAAAILAILYAVLAAVFLSRRESLRVALGFYLITGAFWIGSNAAADVSYTQESLTFLSGIAYIAIGLNLAAFLVIVDRLIARRMPSWKRIAAYCFLNLAPSLFAFSSLAVTSVHFPVGAPAQIVPGPLYTVGLILIVIDFSYGFVRLVRGVRREKDQTRRMQFLYVITGLLITIAGLLIFDVILPLLGEFRFYTLGPMSSIAFVLGCGYAILRHRLMDIRLIVKMLEQKVEERTREVRTLQEEQRRMLMDLSHNLQTPLTVLKNRLERLQRTMADDRELENITQSVDTLSHFIYELLALASLEQALSNEKQAPFSLSRLIEDVCEEVTVIAEQDDISVQSDVVPNMVIVGNEKRLREALMNLASNAVKYMRGDGLKRIRFTLHVENEYAVIAVEDTGIGISEADLPKIFERFYRGTRVYGSPPGTGLGLAFVERIVREHDGTVSVESIPSVGSTFRVRLPVQKVDS